MFKNTFEIYFETSDILGFCERSNSLSGERSKMAENGQGALDRQMNRVGVGCAGEKTKLSRKISLE